MENNPPKRITPDDIFTFVIEHEGAYFNDPIAGPTKYGITKKSFPDIDVENLTKEEALDIYRYLYYEWEVDELIFPYIQANYFDFAFHSGKYRATKYLQKTWNHYFPQWELKEDGILGPITKSYISNVDLVGNVIYFGDSYLFYRQSYMISLAKDKKYRIFLKGWLKRTIDLAKMFERI